MHYTTLYCTRLHSIAQCIMVCFQSLGTSEHSSGQDTKMMKVKVYSKPKQERLQHGPTGGIIITQVLKNQMEAGERIVSVCSIQTFSGMISTVTNLDMHCAYGIHKVRPGAQHFHKATLFLKSHFDIIMEQYRC